MMNYEDTLQYLYNRLPMFTRIGAAAYKADLKNTIQLCASIQNPHLKFKSIHIAGTNGKGSCSHLLASIFQSAGYKTGLYTSPHLFNFNERIKIDGNAINEDWVIKFVEKIKPVIEEIEPSFFEVTVAMAFQYFAEKNIDIAIIETGLGGLLDSTNIIFPELSIITNISMDHTNLLGSTLDSIAKQKAGIIKEKTPIVIGEYQSEIAAVFIETANTKHAELHMAQHEFEYCSSTIEKNLQIINLRETQTNKVISFATDLLGQYQQKNLCTVLSSIQILRTKGYHIQDSALLDGIRSVKKNTGLKGRFDILQTSPTVIADVAHNEAGLSEVFEQVSKHRYKKLHIVTGFVRDKDVHHVLSLFPQHANYYFTQAAIPRALPVNELKEMASEYHLSGQSFSSCTAAIENAILSAENEDLILCTGSFFILSDIYQYIETKNRI